MKKSMRNNKKNERYCPKDAHLYWGRVIELYLCWIKVISMTNNVDFAVLYVLSNGKREKKKKNHHVTASR